MSSARPLTPGAMAFRLVRGFGSTCLISVPANVAWQVLIRHNVLTTTLVNEIAAGAIVYLVVDHVCDAALTELFSMMENPLSFSTRLGIVTASSITGALASGYAAAYVAGTAANPPILVLNVTVACGLSVGRLILTEPESPSWLRSVGLSSVANGVERLRGLAKRYLPV